MGISYGPEDGGSACVETDERFPDNEGDDEDRQDKEDDDGDDGDYVYDEVAEADPEDD